jgi:tRNA pseudouridine65 synthase
VAVRVLLETPELLFVDKPSGMLVHNSAYAGPREHTLVDEVPHGWHPLHRLDRQTSGVIVFAHEPAKWIIEDKHYWALVRGHVREEQRVDHAIVDEDGKSREAVSIIRPLSSSEVERCSLVDVGLLSGRKHQARRHLKHISHPIIGDATHGKGPLNREYKAKYGLMRMALHARSVRVGEHRVVSPLPDDLRGVFDKLGITAPTDP